MPLSLPLVNSNSHYLKKESKKVSSSKTTKLKTVNMEAFTLQSRDLSPEVSL